MITYDQAKKAYEEGRKYKPLGVKFNSNHWLKYDEADDCYVFQYTKSKYFTNAEGKTEKAGPSNREKYTQVDIARVYKDKVFIPCPAYVGSSAVVHFLWNKFGLLVRKNPSIKVSGYQWTKVPPEKNYWDCKHGEGESALSEGRVWLQPGVPMVPECDVRVRAFDKTNQKALNDRIKAMRRILGLRARLGVFQNLNWVDIDRSMRKKYDYAWKILRDPKKVNDLIMAIDKNDFQTMIPVLWLAKTNEHRFYQRWGSVTKDEDWLKVFNQFVESQREVLRKHNGVVSYVSQSEQLVETSAGQTD